MSRTIAEFRIPEELASIYLDPNMGRSLGGSVRKVVVDTTDPLYARIEAIHQELRARGDFFVLGWDLRQKASDEELARAELFHLRITSVFEPSGEECGTEYDESAACPVCGAGRRPAGPLRLNASRVPLNADVAATISRDEWIVSERVVDLLEKVGATGLELRPVEHVGRSKPRTRWFQMLFTSPPVRTVPPTRFGIKPIEPDLEGEYRCPVCTTAGLALISEVWVDRKSWTGDDFVRSREFVGYKRGLLRPAPLLFLSPRIWRLFQEHKVRGFRAEIAYLAPRDVDP